MPQDNQPEFELPPVLRLPQVPPLKVPARRRTQFIVPPSPTRYTEQVPATPPLAPENELFVPIPVTPPLPRQSQAWTRTPYPVYQSRTGMPLRAFVPTGRRSREVGNGEFLLGCALLMFVGLLTLALLTWLVVAK